MEIEKKNDFCQTSTQKPHTSQYIQPSKTTAHDYSHEIQPKGQYHHNVRDKGNERKINEEIRCMKRTVRTDRYPDTRTCAINREKTGKR